MRSDIESEHKQRATGGVGSCTSSWTVPSGRTDATMPGCGEHTNEKLRTSATMMPCCDERAVSVVDGGGEGASAHWTVETTTWSVDCAEAERADPRRTASVRSAPRDIPNSRARRRASVKALGAGSKTDSLRRPL